MGHSPHKAAAVSLGFVHAYALCLDRLACGRSDDWCELEAVEAMKRDPAVRRAVDSCHARRHSCGGGWRDDYCNSLAAIPPHSRAAAEACLQRPCGAIRDCLRSAGARG